MIRAMPVLAEITAVGDDSSLYALVLLLHILSAIAGFGGVMFNGLYAQQSQLRKGKEGVAITQSVISVSNVAEVFIYLTAVFGVLLVLLADEPVGWGDTWIWLSILIYVAALGLSHGVLQPSVRRIAHLSEELASMEGPPPGGGGPPPQVAEIEALGKRVGMTDAALKLALVAILYLMIWKPGLF
jgi:uncharacterized membrane protein